MAFTDRRFASPFAGGTGSEDCRIEEKSESGRAMRTTPKRET